MDILPSKLNSDTLTSLASSHKATFAEIVSSLNRSQNTFFYLKSLILKDLTENKQWNEYLCEWKKANPSYSKLNANILISQLQELYDDSLRENKDLFFLINQSESLAFTSFFGNECIVEILLLCLKRVCLEEECLISLIPVFFQPRLGDLSGVIKITKKTGQPKKPLDVFVESTGNKIILVK